MTEKDRPDHGRDFAKQLDSLQTDWQNIKRVAGPRLDVIDEAQRERDTSDKKLEDTLPRPADTREFAQQQTRKPGQLAPNNPVRPPAEAGSTTGPREQRVFDIHKAFEELDDIKSKIGSARASKPKVIVNNAAHKPAAHRLAGSPPDTLKSQLIGKDSLKTAQNRMAESMRLQNSGDDLQTQAIGDRQAMQRSSASPPQEDAEAHLSQPEWDSRPLGSLEQNNRQQVNTAHETAKRVLNATDEKNKHSQPVPASQAELSSRC